MLGPTNTGKTHLAIERMVAHESGVIGLPLRLLAREVYARVCEKVGAHKVALITGEEKIVPAGARYSVCTVEAMPRETDAAFVAIDEVQLAGDLERGHIFTDRILHLRGRQETLLLGAATMRGILERLLRGISVVTRPRLSHLAYAGQKKLTRLPQPLGDRRLLGRRGLRHRRADPPPARRRSRRARRAVARAPATRRSRSTSPATSTTSSPPTRSAWASISTSTTSPSRRTGNSTAISIATLTAAELGQIAGRAGRHLRDGTFGVTGQVDPLDDELVKKIEAHDFDPVKVLQWRTAAVRLFQPRRAEALDRDAGARRRPDAGAAGGRRAGAGAPCRAIPTSATSPAAAKRVALLWEACALPDYRKIAPAQHADLIASMYHDLAERGHVDETYMAEQVRRADSTDGDIDTLSHRIAQIRTWTFVSNRPGWLADPAHWQEKTREIEDRLSDALHERLTKRFVDRRTSVLMRRLRENTMLEAEISPTGTVLVEGHHVGELQGFRFTADQTAGGEDGKADAGPPRRRRLPPSSRRAPSASPLRANDDIALGSDGILRWIGAPIGTLAAGEDALKPRVVLLADEQLTGPARDKVAARAERFVNFQIETLLKPLVDLKNADQI